jgi:hypothetical protein
MLNQHRCDSCQQRKRDLKDAADDANRAERNHCFHRQSNNHKRGTNEAYDFYVHEVPLSPKSLSNADRRPRCNSEN